MESKIGQVNTEAKVNGYMVSSVAGPTFITETVQEAYAWALVLISKEFTPIVRPYSVIPGGK